jgi:hypothetical protein
VNQLLSLLKQLSAIALILLMQGPAMLVQEVAWAKMLVSYTQERGLKRGVIETFDGNHPCELCAKASQLREEENRKDPAEKPGESQRFRLAWAEMIPSEWLKLPVFSGREIPAPSPMRAVQGQGRGADSPESPPPEVV